MMRRSALKPGTAPMKRGAFARKPADTTGLLRVQSFDREKKTRKPMKSRRPRMTPIRKAARGQDCTINLLGVCNHANETTVLCHSNNLADGKGMGIKAPDTAAAFGCSACHDVLDGRAPRPAGLSKEDVDTAFAAGVERTHAYLRMEGLIE